MDTAARDFQTVYLQAWVHKVAMVLVVVGAVALLLWARLAVVRMPPPPPDVGR